MAEKTIEELQAKLDLLTKDNLQREIELAEAKQKEAEKLAADKEAETLKETLRNEVREELIKQMGDDSKVATPTESAKDAFTGNVASVRLKYAKVPLQMIPGNVETLAAYKEDLTALSSVVEHKTGHKITGRTYEDIVLDMEQKRLYGGN